jgi:hypothetical protein
MSDSSARVDPPDAGDRSAGLDEVETTVQAELDEQAEVDEADALDGALEVPIDEDEYR